jgi:hypothetical protein
MTLVPGQHYLRSADGSLYVVDGTGKLDGSLNADGWSPAGTLLIERGGVYPARPQVGSVVYVGVTDPAALSIDGDVWIQTSSGLSLMAGLMSDADLPVAKVSWWRDWTSRWTA